MNSFVLDCSVTVTWVFDEERLESTDGLLDQVQLHGAFVPDLWKLEISNVLVLAERKNRMSMERVSEFISLLEELPIQTDPHTGRYAFRETLALARRHQLTAYDAAYLELSQRRRLPLATMDKALRRAATAEGINVLPERP